MTSPLASSWSIRVSRRLQVMTTQSPQESTDDGDESPYSIEIELLGPQPLLIRSDSALIELATGNGLA